MPQSSEQKCQDTKYTVGLMAGIKIDFKAPKFPLRSAIGQAHRLDFPTLNTRALDKTFTVGLMARFKIEFEAQDSYR
jgi:hypothetical protein